MERGLFGGSVLIYLLFSIPMLYQAGDITRQFMRQDIKQIVATEPGVPIKTMFICTVVHFETLYQSPLTKYMAAHALTHKDDFEPSWQFKAIKDKSPSSLVTQYQNSHRTFYRPGPRLEQNKAILKPSPRMRRYDCGSIQFMKQNEGNASFKIRANRPPMVRNFWLSLKIPKEQKTRSIQSLTYSFADVEGAILFDTDAYAHTLAVECVPEGYAVRQNVRVKLTKYLNTNHAKRPCREETARNTDTDPRLFPVGAAKLICEAVCESRAFEEALNCSHLAWLAPNADGFRGRMHKRACRSDLMWNEMVKRHEDIRAAARKCELVEDCARARRCEEWDIDVQTLGEKAGVHMGPNFGSTETQILHNIRVIPDATITVVREVPEMSLSQWIATIGGLVGLYFELGLATLAVWMFSRLYKAFTGKKNVGDVQEKSF